MKLIIEAADFEIQEFMKKAGYGFHTYPTKYEMDVASKYPSLPNVEFQSKVRPIGDTGKSIKPKSTKRRKK